MPMTAVTSKAETTVDQPSARSRELYVGKNTYARLTIPKTNLTFSVGALGAGRGCSDLSLPK
jgi:hypothetical protein